MHVLCALKNNLPANGWRRGPEMTDHPSPLETDTGRAAPALLTAKEVAGVLRVSVRTVDNYLARGLLPYSRPPGTRKRLVALEDVLGLIEENKTRSVSASTSPEKENKASDRREYRRGRGGPADEERVARRILGTRSC